MTKILLVEDDKSLREIYGVRLLAEGYDIVSAGDGEEALAMAIKERPQLIVSDVMMPKISGFDMLDILRSTTETKDIKVIMMTALSSEDQRARGESLGADRYLVKSQVGIEDVVRTVHEVLGDAPVAATAAPAFAAPQPTAAARPAAVAPDQPMARPAAAPVYGTTPAAPAPQPQMTTPAPQPQPSSLPQPTAPFSTNRPANLGDRIIQPITKPEVEGPDLASLMEQELSQTPIASSTPTVAPTPLQAAPQAPMSTTTDTEDAMPFIPPTPEQPATDAEEMAFAQQLQQAQQPQAQPAIATPAAPQTPPQPAAPQAPQMSPQPMQQTPPAMSTPVAPPPPPSPFAQSTENHGAIAFEETPRQ